MNYKQKGNLKISKMTLGTVQLGKNYGISNTNGMPSQDQSHNMLTTAARGGVTVLDTSDDYGESEKVIGNYIEQHPEHPFAICTKFSASKKGDKSLYKALKYFAQKSCDALSIRQISFFLSHTEQDYLTYGKELTTALKELKEEGLILNTGISLSRKDCLEEIVDTGAFDAIQMPLSILDNREIQNGMIKKMSDAGIIVFVRSIYLQGLIFQDPQVLRHTKFDAAAPLVEKIQQSWPFLLSGILKESTLW